jgi:uncharacterized protein
MKHAWDPANLDIRAFARAGGQLDGQTPLSALPRLAEEQPVGDGALASAPVTWSLQGETRDVRGGAHQIWLHLKAQGQVALRCQRCLSPMVEALSVDRQFRFVADEATAMAEDDEAEEDLLVLGPAFDALALIEDELLMALPLVPRHPVCPQPLSGPEGLAEPPPELARPNPFAVLSGLKLDKS